MCRKSWLVSICVLALGIASLGANADIYLAVDTTTPAVLVDANIKNVDISQVLSELFNRTGNKYQIQIGVGVAGTIDSLQFTQKPLHDAVDMLLAKAGGKFDVSVEKDTYLISSSTSSGIAPSDIKPLATDKSGVSDSIPTIKTTFMPMPAKTSTSTRGATGATGVGGGSMASLGLGGGTMSGLSGGLPSVGTTASAAEEGMAGMVTINNISVMSLSSAFGYNYLPPLTMVNSNSGTVSGGIGGGTSFSSNGTSSGGYGTTGVGRTGVGTTAPATTAPATTGTPSTPCP